MTAGVSLATSDTSKSRTLKFSFYLSLVLSRVLSHKKETKSGKDRCKKAEHNYFTHLSPAHSTRHLSLIHADLPRFISILAGSTVVFKIPQLLETFTR